MSKYKDDAEKFNEEAEAYFQEQMIKADKYDQLKWEHKAMSSLVLFHPDLFKDYIEYSAKVLDDAQAIWDRYMEDTEAKHKEK